VLTSTGTVLFCMYGTPFVAIFFETRMLNDHSCSADKSGWRAHRIYLEKQTRCLDPSTQTRKPKPLTGIIMRMISTLSFPSLSCLRPLPITFRASVMAIRMTTLFILLLLFTIHLFEYNGTTTLLLPRFKDIIGEARNSGRSWSLRFRHDA
jgi:hypothetical protein